MAGPIPLGGGVLEVENSVLASVLPEVATGGKRNSTPMAVMSKLADDLRSRGYKVSKPVRTASMDARIRLSIDRGHADLFFVDQNDPRDREMLNILKFGIVAFDITSRQTPQALSEKWQRLSSVIEQVLADLFGGARPIWLSKEEIKVEFPVEREP
jgi:hypothetical protein